MASDNLNEVGKSLRETKDRADYASKKVRPNRPSVERTRDIFDSLVDFQMTFDVSPKQKRVGLDLEFNRPPPMQGCFGNNRMQCETFDGLATGNHEVTVWDSYITESVSVFVNATLWPASSWAELSPNEGTVLVNSLPRPTNTITICYLVGLTL
jgi:hypothetical protein